MDRWDRGRHRPLFGMRARAPAVPGEPIRQDDSGLSIWIEESKVRWIDGSKDRRIEVSLGPRPPPAAVRNVGEGSRGPRGNQSVKTTPGFLFGSKNPRLDGFKDPRIQGSTDRWDRGRHRPLFGMRARAPAVPICQVPKVPWENAQTVTSRICSRGRSCSFNSRFFSLKYRSVHSFGNSAMG